MTVQELVKKLTALPQDAQVQVDEDSYPLVYDAVLSDDLGPQGDEEDAPPKNTVLLQVE